MTPDRSTQTVSSGPFTGGTVAGLAHGLRGGDLDPVELAERSVAAATASQPMINAFVSVDREGALRAAEVARRELAGGVDRGPLHGVPVAVKDLVDTAGLATTMGSRFFAGNVPDRDAEVVTRLRAAGAIIVGKTTTHEFAYGPTGDRSANGACANPLDTRLMAGGSSAGSAAAVAAGVVALAVGTDTGGSVRIPAALCGVAGIRPSTGRIPLDGVFPLSPSLDTVGVLAADVAGTAAGWRVLAGLPSTSPEPPPDPPPVDGLRIGLPTGPWFDRLAEPVRAGLDDLLDRLAGLGARLVPVPMPDAEELMEMYRTVQSGEAASIHRGRMGSAPELFDPEVLQRLRAAAAVPEQEYTRAVGRLAEVRGTAGARLDGVDLLLLATVPVPAPPLGSRDGDLGGGWTSPREALLAHNAPFSVLGLPAISVPVARPGGLPVGAQLVGRPGGDEALLAAAGTVEAAIRA